MSVCFACICTLSLFHNQNVFNMKKKNVSIDKLNIKKSTVAEAKGGRPPYRPAEPAEPVRCNSRPQVSCILDWWP